MRILTAAIAALALIGTAHAKVVFVDDNASAGGDGTSWASAHKYLQDALADVNASDEIWVAEGTYKPDQGAGKTAGDRTAPFLLVNGVGMYGGFKGWEAERTPLGDGNQTILSGEINADETFWSLNVVSGVDLDASTILNGFRITKGNANGEGVLANGAGMYLKTSSPTLTNCVFSGNSAKYYGGGMYNVSSSPTLTNCVFAGNSANSDANGDGDGGGIYSSAPLTLTDCAFTGNSADAGGGIYSSAPLNLANCIFTSNSADGYGGGISVTSVILTNCVFTGNSSSEGGGIFSSTDATVTKCVFTGNWAYYGYGGGIRSYSATLANCTFTGNSAKDGGGGSYGGGIYSHAPLNLANCIFTGNSSDGYGGGVFSNNSSTLTNCVFTGNSADLGGGIHSKHFPKPATLTNCIFWENKNLQLTEESHGISGWWKNGAALSETPNSFPRDPNAPVDVYRKIIAQGWTSDDRAVSIDPLFLNIDDPDGPDDKWFTEDDGLRLKVGSPAIDAGYNASLPADTYDLDGDDNKTELLPYDLLGRTRLVGSAVDLGPYEFDPGNPPPSIKWYTVKVISSDFGSSGSAAMSAAIGGGELQQLVLVIGKPPGGGLGGIHYYSAKIPENHQVVLSASRTLGYLFTGWSGDATGPTNPLTITVTSDLNITANFAQDTNDDDGDGLSNYEEIQIGTNPESSDAALVNFFNAKVASNEASARTSALVEGQATGIAAVKADPTAYGLAPMEELTPYTNGWYYQPEWGWIWTNAKTFPYVYRASTGGKQGGWLYFREGSSPPYFHDYATGSWVTIGE